MTFAINDVCARIEIAGDRSNGNILIGSPGGFRQNAGTVGADVDRGRNLMCGILKTVELDQHLLGDAAFGPDRREYLCRGLFSPCGLQDRKSTRLNSSHSSISYAVFCLKKKKIIDP